MFTLKTINFPAHITFLFLLIFPCKAISFRYVPSPPNHNRVLLEQIPNNHNDCDLSLETFVTKERSSSQVMGKFSDLKPPIFLLNTEQNTYNAQTHPKKINSFPNFPNVSIALPSLFDVRSTCNHTLPVLRIPLRSNNSCLAPFKERSKNDTFNENSPLIFLQMPPSVPQNSGFGEPLNHLPIPSNINNTSRRVPQRMADAPQQNNLISTPVRQLSPVKQISAKANKKKKKGKVVKKKSKDTTNKRKKEKKFQCQYCPKRFTRNDTRKVHERYKHINPETFQCKECGRKLNRKWALEQHMRIHTGDLYWCKKCNKGFTTLHSLNQHQRIHTGEKPFKCQKCNKRFRFTSNLKEHERTHMKLKRHRCVFCKKTFKQKKCLTNHLKGLHSDLFQSSS